MDDNNIDIEKMSGTLHKSEIRMYGKPFVDMSYEYIKNELSFYSSMIDIIEPMSDEYKDKLLDNILMFSRSAYLSGCYDGHKYTDDPYKTDDIIVDRNFMIIFDFHDNDFGQLVEDGANKWCELWNSKVNSIGMYKDENIVCDDFYVDLDNLEKLENISKIITNGICTSNIDLKNEYDRYSNKHVPTLENLLDDCKSLITYLDSSNIDNYHKGNIEDIEKYAINEYKGIQNDGDKTPFEKLWVNGEALFIKVEHGYATAFIR